MVKPQTVGKNTRMSFSKINEAIQLPNLIEIQKDSFKWFLETGLMEVLRDISPITDYTGNLFIEFVGYSFDAEPKYPVEECKERDTNYAAPLKVAVRLTNRLTGEVKQSDIFMGDFPLMTDTGTCVLSFLRLSAPPESITIVPSTSPVKKCFLPLLFLIGVLGWNMKQMRTTFIMFVLIKTANFPSPY